MTTRAARRKQLAKNKKAKKSNMKKALRASAQKLQGRFDDSEEEGPVHQVTADLNKLQELFPNMSSSIINQVLANSQSIVDAGEKLGLMTDPLEIPRVNEDIGDEAGTKITIPSVDDDTEYPDLSSTVEGAWNVLDLGQAEIHEDDGARTANELDFVVVTTADLGDWCVVEEEAVVAPIATSSYAQVACT